MLDTILLIAALLSVVGWIHLLWWRGGFWRSDQRLPSHVPAPACYPPIAVIIPARDEEEVIGQAVGSLLRQNYQGSFRIVVVDDNSTDGTAAVALRAAGGDSRFTVLSGEPLPKRWTGKLWAVHQGIESVLSATPDAEFLLLTDADIEHDPNDLTRLVAWAQNKNSDLVSLMVRLRCKTFWERLLVPPFIFFFQKLYPFPWVNDPQRPAAAAAGGCILVRTSMLQSAGGIPAIRDELIDDCALATRIKRHGGIVWLGLSEQTRSLRPYSGLGDIWSMVTRTAFTQLDHSVGKLASTVLGMLVLYMAPPLSVLQGIAGGSVQPVALGFIAWILMAISFAPTLALYGRSSAWALLLPFASCLYVLMTLDSARLTWLGRSGLWKGRCIEGDSAFESRRDSAAIVTESIERR